MGKAIMQVFLALGILMLVLMVLLYLYSNQEAEASLYFMLLSSALLNFGIAIYLYYRNKKNQ